jgi:hypothetical protein
VELSEVEQLVGEAESGVERLRSLYDQYFMGIERIEPAVARKDVERRIQVLRRTQIRNTALRFRFQNVLLRYNTFTAHWMRICREIENGTYKHHLRKAKERFDPQTPQRAKSDASRPTSGVEYEDTERPPPGSVRFELDDGVDVDVDFDDGIDAPDVRAALRSYAIPHDVVAHSVAGSALSAMRAQAAGRSGQGEENRPASAADFDPTEARNTEPAPPPQATVAPAAPPVPAGGPVKPGLATSGQGAAGPRPARSIPPPLPPRARAAKAAPRAAAPPATDPAPPPGASPSPVGAAKSIPPPVPRRRPSSPAVPRRTPPPGRQPPPPPAAAAATRPAPPPTIKGSSPRPAAATGLSDERVAEIYSKYVESRRAMKESTSSVTMDSLARSLRDSSEKLRQKHAGKAVDFEVQVKNGRTVLKPIVR